MAIKPARGAGGGKALMAGPLRKELFLRLPLVDNRIIEIPKETQFFSTFH